MKVYRARDVEEAVQMAEEFRVEGKYDWFRGQSNANWHPSTTLYRAIASGDGDYLKSYQQRIGNFVHWARETPQARHLADPANRDQLFAVLQHYGIPTHYLDFSTDPSVAGFFASHGSREEGDLAESVIFCVDSLDLLGAYETLHSVDGYAEHELEKVVVDVENLWRLQSQRGQFIYTNHNWYDVYPPDRIVFPWTGAAAFPSRDVIYPISKSPLEQVLDEYFESESLSEGRAFLMQMVAEGKMRYAKWESPPEAYRKSFFGSDLVRLPDWSREALSRWITNPSERADSLIERALTFDVPAQVSREQLARKLSSGLRSALGAEPNLRSSQVRLNVKNYDLAFNQTLSSAWDSVRWLPFEDSSVCAMVEKLVEYWCIPGRNSFDWHERVTASQAWLRDPFEIEFEFDNGSSSRAFVPESEFLAAIAPSWRSNFLGDTRALSLTTVLQASYDPSLVFDFTSFAHLFCKYVVPSQIANERSLVLCNPARVKTFGLP